MKIIKCPAVIPNILYKLIGIKTDEGPLSN